MPQLLRVGPYTIYFWSNEGGPLGPVHVHVAPGRPYAGASKLWISSAGRVVVCNNDSGIPERVLRRLVRLVEANSEEIVSSWVEHFGEASFYC